MPYLDHAATSWPKAPGVGPAMAEALSAPPSSWGGRFAVQHAAVAHGLGITDPDRLLLTPGCTSALALALQDVPCTRGDRVLISSNEHHALWRPAQRLAGRGVVVEQLPRGERGPIELGALRQALEAGGVAVVALTAANNITGEMLPLSEIAELVHAAGALLIVDAAQVVGWTLDLPALGADMVAFGGHKGLQGPWGIGGLYVRPGLALAPTTASCALHAGCATLPGYCDGGSVDRAALAGLVVALGWLHAPAQAGRLERARTLLRVLSEAALDLGLRVLGSRDVARRVPSVALVPEGGSVGELGAALRAAGVQCSVGTQCSPTAHAALASSGAVRLSLGPSSSHRDVEQVVEALRRVTLKG